MSNEGEFVDQHPSESVPVKRMPGKYFVIGFVTFVLLLFACSLMLALKLDPAAERFHNPPSPPKKAG